MGKVRKRVCGRRRSGNLGNPLFSNSYPGKISSGQCVQMSSTANKTICPGDFCSRKMDQNLIRKLTKSGKITLAYSGILLHTLAYSGILWHTLAYYCILWHTLAYSGIHWHTLYSRGDHFTSLDSRDLCSLYLFFCALLCLIRAGVLF